MVRMSRIVGTHREQPVYQVSLSSKSLSLVHLTVTGSDRKWQEVKLKQYLAEILPMNNRSL